MKIIDLKTIDKSSQSPYHSGRGNSKVDSIIIHSTESHNFNSTVAGFAHNNEQKSTHFIISREGVIKQLVNPSEAANHGGGFRLKPTNFDAINKEFKKNHGGQGIPVTLRKDSQGVFREMIPKSNINGDFNVNKRSIGIELMNTDNGTQEFTQVQLEALIGLIAALIIEYPNITIDQILGHVDISRDPDSKDFGHTTWGHTDNKSNHTDPKPNFPFKEVKEAIEALLQNTETPDDANFTSSDSQEIHLPEENMQTIETPSDANATNERGEEVHVNSGFSESFEINSTPIDANASLPDGQVVYYGADSNLVFHSQQNLATDSNLSLPDGTTVYHGADSNQIDHSQQSHADSNISLPDETTVYHGADSNQVDHSQQSQADSSMSLPDGTTVYYGADSDQVDHSQQSHADSNISLPDGTTTQDGGDPNQIELHSITEFSSSQWFDPYHHAPIVNHIDPFNVAVHHGADNNQIDHSQQNQPTDSNMILPVETTVHHGADSNQVDPSQQSHSNMSLPDGTTVHHGADSNQVDHSQQSHATDSNMSLPDGTTVHHGADSNQVDHSQQSHPTDHNSNSSHDDGSQSFHP